ALAQRGEVVAAARGGGGVDVRAARGVVCLALEPRAAREGRSEAGEARAAREESGGGRVADQHAEQRDRCSEEGERARGGGAPDARFERLGSRQERALALGVELRAALPLAACVHVVELA